jgi:hypothetical protein
MKTDDGRLIIISGASRSGKTAYTVKRVARDRRIMAWDPHDQWGRLKGWRRVTDQHELLEAAGNPGPMKVAYVVKGVGSYLKAEFEFWAAAVRYWLLYAGPGVAIAEELAEVSTAGKAPERWGRLIREGLKRGGTIYAISQRWAEADKTAFGNQSEIVCFSLARLGDRRYMASEMDLPVSEIEALVPEYHPDGRAKTLPYIRVTRTREIERGRLKF